MKGEVNGDSGSSGTSYISGASGTTGISGGSDMCRMSGNKMSSPIYYLFSRLAFQLAGLPASLALTERGWNVRMPTVRGYRSVVGPHSSKVVTPVRIWLPAPSFRSPLAALCS